MTLYTQWLTMLVMFSSGLLLGMLLDVVRVCRERYQIRKNLQPLIDIFYWFLSAILIFRLLWWSNWGELRFYIFVAICLGFFLYFQSLSDFMRNILNRIIRWFEWIMRVLYRLLNLVFWKPSKKLLVILRAVLFGLVLVPFLSGKRWIRSVMNKNREKK